MNIGRIVASVILVALCLNAILTGLVGSWIIFLVAAVIYGILFPRLGTSASEALASRRLSRLEREEDDAFLDSLTEEEVGRLHLISTKELNRMQKEFNAKR